MLFWILLTACFSTKLPPSLPTQTFHNYKIDYSGLFGIPTSESLYDRRLVQDDTLNRVLFEPDIFVPRTETSTMSLWIRNRLLSYIGELGSVIVAPSLPADLDPRQPCPTGGCYTEAPTTVIRHVYFRFVTETIPVVVQQGGGETFVVLLRAHPEQKSLCSDDAQTTIEYAEFGAMLQRFNDGGVIGLIHEVSLLPKPEQSVVSIKVPTTSGQKQFCETVLSTHAAHKALQPTDDAYQKTTRKVLKKAFAPIVVEQKKRMSEQQKE